MSSGRRRSTVASWVLVVWAGLLGVWAMQPLNDQVPTGDVEGVETSVSVECARPIDADPGPVGDLPELEPPRQYERQPCVEQHSDNRWMLLVNVVLIAALAIGLVVLRIRARRAAPNGEPARAPSHTQP